MLSNDDILNRARTLPIPVPWDRNVFIGNLAEQRRRPILLIPSDTVSHADSPCGLWLARTHDDVIIHDIGTSEYHIDQIICHEVGHMVLGHDNALWRNETEDCVEGALYRDVLPNIDPDIVRNVLGGLIGDGDSERGEDDGAETLASALRPCGIRTVLGRSDYSSDQEREAETFASLLMIAAAEAVDERSMMRTVFFRSR